MSHSDTSHAESDDGNVHSHVSSLRFLWGIFGALIVLTVVTVGASYVDFGPANTVVAVLIATVKAALVASFFMHLRYDKIFNTILFVSAFLFLALFFGFTREDVDYRGDITRANGGSFYPRAGEWAPGGMGSVRFEKPPLLEQKKH